MYLEDWGLQLSIIELWKKIMKHENLYGNVERVFRSGPDSIYLYTNTILDINL
jgi:hypothetical protein